MSAQDINNARFTKEAVEWDSNKKHVESTQKALEAVLRYVPAFKDGSNTDTDVLEIGCGTGLLSFILAPHVRSLIGVDTADGMISAFDTKLGDLDPSKANICSLNHFLTSADSPELQQAAATLAAKVNSKAEKPYRFDLAVSHLTLHHIPSLPEIFSTLFECLKSGGTVALTDYEDFGSEAIRFHPVSKRPGVERHGLKRKEIEAQLKKAGFTQVRIEEAFVLAKEVEAEDGMAVLNGEMEFPFLMCYGVKP